MPVKSEKNKVKVDFSPEFEKFNLSERGESGKGQETVWQSPGGNVWIYREGGSAYLCWGKQWDKVCPGWVTGFMERIIGKSDEVAYDILQGDRLNDRIKILQTDVDKHKNW